MNTRSLTPSYLVAALAVSAATGSACSGTEEPASAVRLEAGSCGPIPPEIEQRFEAMRGPLGCAATVTPMPDPPGGCAGADQLLASARAEYSRLWAEGGCSGEPPDLTSLVSDYERRYARRHPFVEHEIARDEFVISAREFGAEHAGTGPLIVLMHGFPDNQHLYDLVAPALAETQHVVTFDFVGWGDSSVPPPGHMFTYADLRRDLEAVLAHFGASQVVPVVHDASGFPGIDWALDNTDSVTALVLLNTTYQPIEGSAPPYVIRALSALDRRPEFLVTRAVFRAQVGTFFTRPSRERTFLPLLEHDIPTARAGLFGLTETLLENTAARLANVPRMQAFSRPVTVAFGADDPYLNPTVARAFAATFPGSRLELIQRAGHYVQLDQPGRVVELVRAATCQNVPRDAR